MKKLFIIAGLASLSVFGHAFAEQIPANIFDGSAASVTVAKASESKPASSESGKPKLIERTPRTKVVINDIKAGGSGLTVKENEDPSKAVPTIIKTTEQVSGNGVSFLVGIGALILIVIIGMIAFRKDSHHEEIHKVFSEDKKD